MGNFTANVALFPDGAAPAGWVLCDGHAFEIDKLKLFYTLFGMPPLPKLESPAKGLKYYVRVQGGEYPWGGD